MVKLTLTILACVMLSACMPKVATKEKIVTEDVPVFVIPKPPEHQPRPALEIDKLTPEERKNINREAQAYAVTVAQLKSYAEDLEAIVNKYNELSNTSTPITNFDPKTPALLNIDRLKEFLDKYKPGAK